MRIGEVARLSGVRAKTIRYYEQSGLIEPPQRNASGYRDYAERDVQILRFIRRARRLGFSVTDIGRLLGLWNDQKRASGDVKELAAAHLADVERRIDELQSIRTTLVDLIGACHGDERPDCPIIEGLSRAQRSE